MRSALLFGIGTLLFLQNGCAAPAIIAGASTAGFALAQGQAEAFINGELKAARMVPIENALHATVAAITELQAPIRYRRRGKYDAYIMARAEGGPEIRVTLTAKTPVATKIEIRIGLMGDQAVARLVMSRIDYKLGIEQPVVPVEVSPIVAPPPAATHPAATQPAPPHSSPPATEPSIPPSQSGVESAADVR